MIANILSHQCPLCIFKTEPLPVSGLRVVFAGVTKVSLAWKNENDNDNATSRMLLEDTRNQTIVANISGLKSGLQYKVTLYLSESSETQRDPLVTESGSGELQKRASHLPDALGFH